MGGFTGSEQELHHEGETWLTCWSVRYYYHIYNKTYRIIHHVEKYICYIRHWNVWIFGRATFLKLSKQKVRKIEHLRAIWTDESKFKEFVSRPRTFVRRPLGLKMLAECIIPTEIQLVFLLYISKMLSHGNVSNITPIEIRIILVGLFLRYI